MKLIKKRSFPGFVKILLDFLFLATIVFLIFSPKISKIFIEARFFSAKPYLYKTILGIIIFSDIAIIFVLYELRKIFKTITASTPFIEANVASLFRMGIASFLLAAFFIMKAFILQSLLTYVVIFVLIIAGCFSWVLSEVFKEALRVKEENDLTI